MTRLTLPRLRRLLVIGALDGADHDLACSLEEYERFQIERVSTAAAGMARLTANGHQPDALLIADGMPDDDPATLCAHIRQRGFTMPIVVLAAPPCFRLAEGDVVRALDSGANDVIAAPFRRAEVIARLNAQMRAHDSSDDAILVVGPYQFRPARRMLTHVQTGARLRLTEKEAAVLKFLYRTEGPVSRNALLNEVWGYNDNATTHTVETHIYRLRRKIEPNPEAISLLISEHGGYRLIMPAQHRVDHRAAQTLREPALA
jgi:DNA-binding response OmpR family regulator